MDRVKHASDQYLAGEDTDLSSAMFSAYRPAMESYYSTEFELHQSKRRPIEKHGDPWKAICRGSLSPLKKTEWKAPVEHESLTIQQHVMEFLISAR